MNVFLCDVYELLDFCSVYFVLIENIECFGVCSFQLDICVCKMVEKYVYYSDIVYVQLDLWQLVSIFVFCILQMEFQNLYVLDFFVVFVDFFGYQDGLVVDFVYGYFCLVKEEGNICFYYNFVNLFCFFCGIFYYIGFDIVFVFLN